MITVSDSYEPPWVTTAAARLVWRRTLIVNIAGVMGFSSAFIADAFSVGSGLSASGVRKILRSEASRDPLITQLKAQMRRSSGSTRS